MKRIIFLFFIFFHKILGTFELLDDQEILLPQVDSLQVRLNNSKFDRIDMTSLFQICDEQKSISYKELRQLIKKLKIPELSLRAPWIPSEADRELLLGIILSDLRTVKRINNYV